MNFSYWRRQVIGPSKSESVAPRPSDMAAVFALAPSAELHFVRECLERASELRLDWDPYVLDLGLLNLLREGMGSMRSLEVDIADRVACIKATAVLYEEVFRQTYTYASRNGDPFGNRIPGDACFMWWDLYPLTPTGPETYPAEIRNAVFDVLEYAVGLNSRSCQESALHGLGHWRASDPRRTAQLVQKFVRNHSPDDLLAEYASAASAGLVE